MYPLLQVDAERFVREADDAQTQNTVVCKVLDEMRVGVKKLFKVNLCVCERALSLCFHKEGLHIVTAVSFSPNINRYGI